MFAKSHPQEVMGLVLVDSRHRDFLAACEAAKLDLCGIPEATLALQARAVIDEYRSFARVSDQIRIAGAFAPLSSSCPKGCQVHEFSGTPVALGSDGRLFGATTLPIGTGAGNAPNVGAAKTNAASAKPRPADDVMFAVNYMTAIAGFDLAYVHRGFTALGEATLQQYVRVRGDNSAAATDPFRTNSAVGLHLGYFIGSHFSLSGDVRYQRWLSHPTVMDAETRAHVQSSDAQMDTLTVADGPRLHFRLGKKAWIRPGVSFVRRLDSRGIEAPLLTGQTRAVQIDIPVMF